MGSLESSHNDVIDAHPIQLFTRIVLLLKIQAADIQMGDRIVAYCNNKMQICTVKHILDPDLNNVTLAVFTSESSRNSVARVVRFQRDALVELHAKSSNAEVISLEVPEEPLKRP